MLALKSSPSTSPPGKTCHLPSQQSLWPGYNCQLSCRYPLWQFVGPRRHLENSLDISPAYPQISLVAAQLFLEVPSYSEKTSQRTVYFFPNWGSLKMLTQSTETHQNHDVFSINPWQAHPFAPLSHGNYQCFLCRCRRRCLPSISTFSMWSLSSIAFFVSGHHQAVLKWVKSSPNEQNDLILVGLGWWNEPNTSHKNWSWWKRTCKGKSSRGNGSNRNTL